jgi:uncharacterized protein (DUF1800 family)
VRRADRPVRRQGDPPACRRPVRRHGFPEGEAGGVAALAHLAAHPATHRHLAAKLARHFVADDPPPDAVRAIEGALRDGQGDLGATAETVTRIEAAWRPATKLRAPGD